MRFSTLLQLALVVFGSSPAWAEYDQKLLYTLLGARPFDGFLGEKVSDELANIREVRFIFDGENARLLRAGLEPMDLPTKYLYTQIGRHPNGPWKVYILRWALPTVLVEMVFRPDEALTHGVGKTLPRILLSFRERSSGEVLAQGGLVTEDQPDVLGQMRAAFKGINMDYLSFNEAQRTECERLLNQNLIRTQR